MKKRGPKPAIPVRVKVVSEFGRAFPPTAAALIGWFNSQPRPLQQMSFSVGALPPSVNHMYARTAGGGRTLSQETLNFRSHTAVAIGAQRFNWKPAGAVAALIFLESPHWVNKRHLITDMDGDNRVKSLFDAIQACTDVPDNTNWEHHVWKAFSRHTRTTVYLFDLGDLVEYYS